MKDDLRWNERDYNFEIRSIKKALDAGSPYLDRGVYGSVYLVHHIDSLIREIHREGIKNCNNAEGVLSELNELLRQARVVAQEYEKTKSGKKTELRRFNKKNFLYRFFHHKTKKRLTEELDQLDPERIKR